MPYKQYTTAQKLAYYKRKAAQASVRRAPARRAPVRRVPYNRYRANYRKPYRYPGLGGRIGRFAGSTIGSFVPVVGAGMGGALGEVVGRGAHSLLKTVTGFGDYKISKNSLMYNEDSVPEFSNNNERCTFITHKEFITDIESSQFFQNREFRINPAVATTFPWLSQVAENYEQYVVQGMLFEYKTTSATAIGSVNTGLGTVVLATQYNSLSEPFVNKRQMENHEFCQSTVPSNSVIHAIECDPAQTQCGGIYNTWNPANSSGDIRLYDMGRFNIATVGMQSDGAIIGELWVTYKICLLKPKLISMNDLADGYLLQASSVSNDLPLGNPEFTIPYSINDNFTTPGLGDSYNEIEIDPSFTGVLRCAYYCTPGSGGVTGANVLAPYWIKVGSSSIEDVTPLYAGNTAANARTNWVKGSDPDVRFTQSVGYFKVSGGFDLNGDRARIAVIEMDVTGSPGISNARIELSSVPANLASLSNSA